MPIQLTPVGKIVSDTTLMTLNAIETCQGQENAEAIADGYVDGAERYMRGESCFPTAAE